MSAKQIVVSSGEEALGSNIRQVAVAYTQVAPLLELLCSCALENQSPRKMHRYRGASTRKVATDQFKNCSTL